MPRCVLDARFDHGSRERLCRGLAGQLLHGLAVVGQRRAEIAACQIDRAQAGIGTSRDGVLADSNRAKS